MQKTVIESRFLDVADWPKLAPFFAGSPDKMPDPLTALIAGAFLDGVLVGFVHITPTFLIKNAWSLRDDAMQSVMQLIDTVIGKPRGRERHPALGLRGVTTLTIVAVPLLLALTVVALWLPDSAVVQGLIRGLG